MKRVLLLILLLLFGAMLYFLYTSSILYWPFLPAMGVVLALYYVSTSVVTKSMVAKIRNEDFFIVKANKASDDGKELIPGALVVTKDELIFYTRKNWNGGVKVIWSGFTNSLEGYSLARVDDKHRGIILNYPKEEVVKIGSPSISKKEKEFRAALGWPEEAK